MAKKLNKIDFASLILSTRQQLGESQAEFGRRFGAGGNTVSRWETGVYEPTMPAIQFVLTFERTEIECRVCKGSGRIWQR